MRRILLLGFLLTLGVSVYLAVHHRIPAVVSGAMTGLPASRARKPRLSSDGNSNAKPGLRRRLRRRQDRRTVQMQGSALFQRRPTVRHD